MFEDGSFVRRTRSLRGCLGIAIMGLVLYGGSEPTIQTGIRIWILWLTTIGGRIRCRGVTEPGGLRRGPQGRGRLGFASAG